MDVGPWEDIVTILRHINTGTPKGESNLDQILTSAMCLTTG